MSSRQNFNLRNRVSMPRRCEKWIRGNRANLSLSAAVISIAGSRRPGHSLQRNRPPDDVHLRMQSDSFGMQSRWLPRFRWDAQRTNGGGNTR